MEPGPEVLTSGRKPLVPFGLGWPNIVSVCRILLVPVLMWLLLIQDRTASTVAAAVFAVGAATDGVDGYLARRYRAISKTGQWLDPLADKLLVSTPVVILTVLGAFPLWAATIVVARELAVSILRVVLGLRGVSLPASRSAKVKTALQLAAITLYILPLAHGASGPKLAVLTIAVAFTVATGLEYFVRDVGWLRKGRSRDDGTAVRGARP